MLSCSVAAVVGMTGEKSFHPSTFKNLKNPKNATNVGVLGRQPPSGKVNIRTLYFTELD